MNSALLLAGGVVLVVVAVVYLNERRIRGARRRGEALEGFGGWLLLLAIGQWLMLAGLVCALPFMVLGGLTWLENDSPAIGLAQSPFVAAAAAFALYVNVTMTRKRRAFPRLFRVQIVLSIVLPLVLILIEAAMASPTAAPVQWKSEIAGMVMPAIIAAVWFLYSLRSVRVRNTFVR